MFNSFHGETLKTYQNWVAGSFRAPVVPGRVQDDLSGEGMKAMKLIVLRSEVPPLRRVAKVE